MRTSRILLASVFVLCFGGLAAAQQQASQISRVVFVTPKPGMEMQFEEVTKKHMAWHAQRKDTSRWDARYTITGRRSGEYVFISGGQQWKDMDKPVVPEADDFQHWLSTTSQFVADWSSIIIVSRPDLSRVELAVAAPLSAVTYYYIKYGQTAKFVEAQRRIREALEKTNAPVRSAWSQVIFSNENSVFVSGAPRDNWAGFELTRPLTRERVEEVFGRARTEAIYQALEESVERTESKVTVSRPDLSYVPAGR